MATRPFENPNPQEEMQPVSSGSMKSSLDKVLQKDTKTSGERQWARELVRVIPQNLLGKATDFIQSYSVRANPEELAQELLDEIKSRDVLRATDQEIALEDCIRKVKDRHRPN